VEFGVGIFPTEDAQLPSELARMAEERGFEYLLFPSTRTSPPAARRRIPPGERFRPSTAARTTRSSR